jgi:hypothetical protein
VKGGGRQKENTYQSIDSEEASSSIISVESTLPKTFDTILKCV